MHVRIIYCPARILEIHIPKGSLAVILWFCELCPLEGGYGITKCNE